jgi:hypothetical protein
MSVEHVKSDLRYGLFLIERTGLNEATMDKIKSAIKNASDEHSEAMSLIYAEDVN